MFFQHIVIHHAVQVYHRGTLETLLSIVSLAVISQDHSFRIVHTVLCLVNPQEHATFKKSSFFSVMNYSPVAQLVTFVFEVVTVHMRGEWNYAVRDCGEELQVIQDGVHKMQWLLVGNLVFLSNVSPKFYYNIIMV